MQKPIAIILSFIFSFCLFSSGAFGYADCESQCCCKSAMMGSDQASHTMHASKNTSLTKPPDCCSGPMATACEFSRGTAARLPETFTATIRAEATDFSSTGLTPTNLLIENAQPQIYTRGPDPWLKTKPLPIYLQIHSFLC